VGRLGETRRLRDQRTEGESEAIHLRGSRAECERIIPIILPVIMYSAQFRQWPHCAAAESPRGIRRPHLHRGPSDVSDIDCLSNLTHITLSQVFRCRHNRVVLLILIQLPHMQDQRVLVTGGAGFIGSNVANYLARNNDVIALDDEYLGTPTTFLKTSPTTTRVSSTTICQQMSMSCITLQRCRRTRCTKRIRNSVLA